MNIIRLLFATLLLVPDMIALPPKQGQLAADLQLPLIADGKNVGFIGLKAGDMVTIVQTTPDGVLISRGEGAPVKVAREALTRESLVEAAPASRIVATSSPTPLPQPTALVTPKHTNPVATAISSGSTNVTSPEEVNKTLGLNLFTTGNLWQECDAEVAKRLNLPLETRTSYESGYGYEPQGKRRVLGAESFSIYLQGLNGNVGRISILFANKGDIFHYATHEELNQLRQQAERFAKSSDYRPTVSTQMMQKFEAAIRSDQQTMSAELVKLFGPGLPARNYKTSWMSEEGTKWVWNGTTFFLFAPRNEYLTLRIEQGSSDNYLENERKAFATARPLIASRIQHRPNGDVIIGDIPMVNQGSRGYCVPATIERVLRYYNIPADMNMLAMAGQSSASGGTSFDNILPTINDLARNAGGLLNQRQFSGRISDIKQVIDEGKPVIWGLYSSGEFNRRMADRNSKRKTVTDWTKWSNDLQVMRASAPLLPHEGSHCCMIIGYNEKSREIALSDSWGSEYRERWMTEEEAAAIKQGSMATIGW